jgi:hypothetical protein
MNLILVSIGNFQEYILDNIKQLLILEISNIYVITNSVFFDKFEIYKDKINIIAIETLNDTYNFFNETSLDKNFRNGFWTLTSLRFFYIYSLMGKYNLKNCIHIENDVLLYYNINTIQNMFNENYIYIPFDTYTRNIASIMYIPNCGIFKNVLDKYDFTKNDMENFAYIKLNTGLIQNMPIFPVNFVTSKEELFVCENFDTFNFIFDAAAIGQFLGGVDPKNISGDTTGFVNETCVIKYNKYNFIWEIENNIKKPYLFINNLKFPIFNLHIHSKNLLKFML